MPIDRLMEGAGFDAEQTARLGVAFDVAWELLHAENQRPAHDNSTDRAREALARCVVNEGLRGERDVARLVAKVLARFRDVSDKPLAHATTAPK